MNDDATGLIERAIATGDHEFRELADFAPVMIWRSGPDKLCDWFNKPWLEYTGRDMAAEVGNGWATGVHPDDLERCLETYVDAFDARKPFSMEYRLRRYDGQYRWLLDNGAPFHRGGAFAGYWGSCVDVSNHRDAERAQRIVINDLNHRMKNVLAVVQAMAMQSFTDDRPLDISMSAFGSRAARAGTRARPAPGPLAQRPHPARGDPIRRRPARSGKGPDHLRGPAPRARPGSRRGDGHGHT